MSAPLLNILLLARALAVGSSPLGQTTSSSFLVNFHHSRAAKNLTAIQSVNDSLPALVTEELQTVQLKYSTAAQYLAGVGLQTDTHPEDGYQDYKPPTAFGPSITPSTGSPHVLGDSDDHAPGIIEMPPWGPATAQMPLTDYISGAMDVLYYGPMSFGSPAQVLTVDVDTGSADLWMPSGCSRCRNTQFDSKRSSTYRGATDECMVTYGIGKISGTLAQDTVSVGHATVSQQSFCAVHRVSNELNAEPNSGLLGLAFATIARSGKPTFFENLLAERKVADSIFSVHFARKKETSSQVCFGCADPTKMMGPVRWIPLVSRTYWSIAMNGLSTNTTTQPISTNLTALVDTGTSLIYLPGAIAERFYSTIPGSERIGKGYYTFPCNLSVSVTFNLDGKPYEISPSDFNLGPINEQSQDCIGGINGADGPFYENIVILGAVFLKSWYSVFDYSGRVGFAPSVNNK